MALNKDLLKNQIRTAYSQFNLYPIAATLTANAIGEYWATGISNLGGSVNPAPSIPIIIGGLNDAWSSYNASPDIVAKKVADAIDKGMLAVIISGGAHGIGGIASTTKSLLISGLRDAYSISDSFSHHASKFADAVHLYTSQGTRRN